ncbi:MAG: cell envelope-related transcriptional attenuator [Actinomycetia bacterium]|nr:cell envelope-related transcriptional attenuator [Actinomycetes bacterium]
MVDELRDALEAASARGNPAGGEEVLRRAEAEVGPRGRRTIRVVIGLTTAAAVLAAALVGGGVLYGRAKLDDIDRVDLATELAGAATPSEPMNVLVVGSDSRASLAGGDEPTFGSADDVGGARADAIMVVRLDAAAGKAVVLSVPRDLWVPVDGGANQRINTALAGGPDALVRTVQDVLGIRLDHYVQFDFDGFRRVVDAVGGVQVRFTTPVRDRVSGLDVRTAGCQTLDGDEGLALVRSRHVQYQVDGEWRTDPTGDLSRIERQQVFLVAALAHAAEARNPVTLLHLLDAAADHLTIDAGLSTDDLLGLGRDLGGIGGGDMTSVRLPVRNTRIGDAAVLVADPADLLAAGALLDGTASPTTSTPSTVMSRFSNPSVAAAGVTLLPSCDK